MLARCSPEMVCLQAQLLMLWLLPVTVHGCIPGNEPHVTRACQQLMHLFCLGFGNHTGQLNSEHLTPDFKTKAWNPEPMNTSSLQKPSLPTELCFGTTTRTCSSFQIRHYQDLHAACQVIAPPQSRPDRHAASRKKRMHGTDHRWHLEISVCKKARPKRLIRLAW